MFVEGLEGIWPSQRMAIIYHIRAWTFLRLARVVSVRWWPTLVLGEFDILTERGKSKKLFAALFGCLLIRFA